MNSVKPQFNVSSSIPKSDGQVWFCCISKRTRDSPLNPEFRENRTTTHHRIFRLVHLILMRPFIKLGAMHIQTLSFILVVNISKNNV